MFEDYPVKFLLDSEVQEVADEVRRRLFGEYLPGRAMFAGLRRFQALKFIPQPDNLLGEYDAYVSVGTKRIICKQSVYDAMRRGVVEGCATFAHELGHYVLHPAKELRFLATDGNNAPFYIPPNESAERQAWLFADALQMPSWAVWQVDNAGELASLCNVSLERAQHRWQQVRENVRPVPKPTVERSIEEDAWNVAAQIPGEDPDINRKAGIYRIRKSELKMMSQCGWFVRDGMAVAWITLDQQW
jgi:hypothetical protein